MVFQQGELQLPLQVSDHFTGPALARSAVCRSGDSHVFAANPTEFNLCARCAPDATMLGCWESVQKAGKCLPSCVLVRCGACIGRQDCTHLSPESHADVALLC